MHPIVKKLMVMNTFIFCLLVIFFKIHFHVFPVYFITVKTKYCNDLKKSLTNLLLI